MRAAWIWTLGGLSAVLLVVQSAAAQIGTNPNKNVGRPSVQIPNRSPTAPIGGRPVGVPGFVPSGSSPTGPNGFLPGGTRYQGSQSVTLGPGAVYGGYQYYPYYYPPTYGYGPYGTYPYGNYSDPYNSGYYYPGYYYQPAPIFAPTDTYFGPGSIQRQMQFHSPPRNSSNRLRTGSRTANDLAVARAVTVPPIAGKTRVDARQFIQYGDDNFRKGQYAEALQRYRRAGVIDPTLAAAFFRQGHTFVALGTYDRASDLYQHGLELDPDWAESVREFDDLYGRAAARPEQLESLVSAAEDHPRDADLLFVLGVQYYFDHKTEQAVETLKRAADLGAANRVAIETFLQGIPGSEDPADGAQAADGAAANDGIPDDDGVAPPPKPAGEK